MNYLNKSTVKRLGAKGITVVGLQHIPDENGSCANGTVGYRVDDNGTGRVWTAAQVQEASA